MLADFTKKRTGFTIVELLIVVVVIAILAAITIVAYNGIQNRAKQSAAQSLVSQVNKKILTYAVQNNDDYPANLDSIGISATDKAKLQYSFNNNVTPHTYGLTVTEGVYSYYMSNTVSQPTSGGYQGHGQGGVAAITNLVPNPSVESDLSNISTGGYGTGGVGSITRTNDGYQGGWAATLAWTTAATGGGATLYGAYAGYANSIPVTAGKTYRLSFWGKVSTSASSAIHLIFNDNTNTVVLSSIEPVTATANTWTLYTTTAVAPAGATKLDFGLRVPSLAGTPNGFSMKIDKMMLTEGSTTYTYADGSSPNWAWSDVVNNSPSSGPPL